jgi:hypothetical protein
MIDYTAGVAAYSLLPVEGMFVWYEVVVINGRDPRVWAER